MRTRRSGSSIRRRIAAASAVAFPGVDEQARDLVLHELGDAGQATGDHREPAAHGLHEDDRDALALAVPGDDARRDEKIGSPESSDHFGAGPTAIECHDVTETGVIDPGLQPRFILALPDEPAAEVQPRLHEQATGVDENGLALHFMERPDRQDREWSRGGVAIGERSKERRVDSAMDDMDALARPFTALRHDLFEVVPRDGDDERGLADLADPACGDPRGGPTHGRRN